VSVPAQQHATIGDFGAYRRLLFSALKRLRQQGFVAAPDEGVDLIHDFYLEAWPGVVQRFDPARGRFSTFLFQAFVRFARPRIIRLARWDLIGEGAEHYPVAQQRDLELELDVVRVREALEALPRADRELLEARLQGRSERALGRERGVSRYAIREVTLRALAQLLAQMRDRTLLDEEERALANIWALQRSEPELAAELNLTVSQLRGRKQRFLESLAKVLVRATGASNHEPEET